MAAAPAEGTFTVVVPRHPDRAALALFSSHHEAAPQPAQPPPGLSRSLPYRAMRPVARRLDAGPGAGAFQPEEALAAAAKQARRGEGGWELRDGNVLGTTKIVDNGPNGSRFNIVLMGDGYQASQMAKFAQDAQRFVDALFAAAPFDSPRALINVHRVDVTSLDSGAD